MTDRQIALLSLAVSGLAVLWTVVWSVWLDRRVPPVHVATNATIAIEFSQQGLTPAQYRIRVSNVGAQPCLLTNVDLRLRTRELQYSTVVPTEWMGFSLPVMLEPGAFVNLPAIDLASLRTFFETTFGGPREWWNLELLVREAAGREFVTAQAIPGYMPLK